MKETIDRLVSVANGLYHFIYNNRIEFATVTLTEDKERLIKAVDLFICSGLDTLAKVDGESISKYENRLFEIKERYNDLLETVMSAKMAVIKHIDSFSIME